MRYKVKFSSGWIDKMQDMYLFEPPLILGWVHKNIETIRRKPRLLGQGLYSKDDSIWQYRLGRYRMLAMISDDTNVILFTALLQGGEEYLKSEGK